MKKIITTICGFFFLTPLTASAQICSDCVFDPASIYLSAFLERQSLGVDESREQFKPLLVSGVVGFWVRKGIGLEVEGGLDLINDDIGALDLDSVTNFGLNLRLESDPAERYSAYALFGYVRSGLKLSDRVSESSLSLPGGKLALGLTYKVSSRLYADASFIHHDYDEDTRINSFRLGVRFGMNSGN